MCLNRLSDTQFTFWNMSHYEHVISLYDDVIYLIYGETRGIQSKQECLIQLQTEVLP